MKVTSRKEVKKKRLALLAEIDDIVDEYCKPCTVNFYQRGPDACKGCDWYQKLRKNGDDLDKLSDARRDKYEDVEWFPSLYNIRKLKESGLDNPDIAKLFGMSIKTFYKYKLKWEVEEMELTVELYKDLKGQGKSDKEIAEQYEMDSNQMYKFKKQHNLIGKFNSHTEQAEASKLKALEQQNAALKEENKKLLADLKECKKPSENVDVLVIDAERELFRNAWIEQIRKSAEA